jgi:hypothetical protein
MITMESTNKLGRENVEKVMTLFQSNVALTAIDVSNLSDLTHVTARRTMNKLVNTGKLSKVGYKAKVGTIYAPVAEHLRLVTLGDASLTPTQVIQYLIQNDISPFAFLDQKSWNQMRKLILFKLYAKSERVTIPADLENLNKLAEHLKSQAKDFFKLMDSLATGDFANENLMKAVGGELDSLDEGYNTFNDLLKVLNSSQAPTKVETEEVVGVSDE